MKIFKTPDYGYCYGVKRAVAALNEALEKYGAPVYCYGYIIHNPEINAAFEASGVVFTEDVSSIPNGAKLFIRAHGVGAATESYLRSNFKVTDMTCPNVLRIHSIAQKSEKLLIFGDETHPEVIGTKGCAAGECLVFGSVSELSRIKDKLSDGAWTLVSQTTASLEDYEKAAELLHSAGIIKEKYDTVCHATGVRQKEVESLSSACDAFIIVGGKNSANTRKLYDIALSHCKAFHIENITQLPFDELKGCERIGLSSGTSTPAEAIEEVICKMVNENETNQVEGAVNSESEEFLHAMEGSIKLVRRGYRVQGTVTAINGSEVQVDLGGKHSGIIPASEFTDDEEPLKIGDEIEAVVVKVDDVEGTALLSKREIDSIKNQEKVKKAAESGEYLKAKITEVVKGGLLANLSGVRIFIPGSQVSIKRNVKLEDYPGKEVTLKIIDFDESKRKIVGSIRAVLEEENEKEAEKLWSTLEVGQRRQGIVSSICDFGAFVNIGGTDGLVHITDLSWGRKENVSDIVKVGDEVTVIVKNFNPETRKISLTMKMPEQNPWTVLNEKYHIGDIIEVTILRLTPYGAFVSVVPGADGLIHISQISKERVNNINDVLKVGQNVKVKIINIDPETKKIALSIKAALEDEESAAEAASTEAGDSETSAE